MKGAFCGGRSLVLLGQFPCRSHEVCPCSGPVVGEQGPERGQTLLSASKMKLPSCSTENRLSDDAYYSARLEKLLPNASTNRVAVTCVSTTQPTSSLQHISFTHHFV